MICKYFKNDSLNLLSEKDQQEHVDNCSYCSKYKNFDDFLFEQVRDLKKIDPPADLWTKIERDLQNNTIENKSPGLNKEPGLKLWLSIAASIIIFISAGIYALSEPAFDTRILSDYSLLKVELTERNYISAIEKLEDQARTKLAEADLELMHLYKDKLKTIDIQIKRCQNEISKNPGNAHIRRYLLTALQDKKETLIEIINISLRS